MELERPGQKDRAHSIGHTLTGWWSYAEQAREITPRGAHPT